MTTGQLRHAIDIGPLLDPSDPTAPSTVGCLIDEACRDDGFFTIVGHGVAPGLQDELERLAAEFFALDEAEKEQIAMARGGAAWRGWFPVGAELTSGVADAKEGIYFGTELAAEDERVRAGRLLHGANLWPSRPAGLRPVVERWMHEMERVGRLLLGAIAAALELPPGFFDAALSDEPTRLFRIFHYLPTGAGSESWGVGAHTDYGLLTLLGQDATGGLEVAVAGQWVAVPVVPHALVCNIGDMFERITAGRYRSTLHRVRPPVGTSRLSFPFFLDPGWDVEVAALALPARDGWSSPAGGVQRWDGATLEELQGTYGDYLMTKVSRVFPDLSSRVRP